jgi:hypothetical protein
MSCTVLFYSNDRFLHIIIYYFQNNDNFTDRANPHYDKLWKIRRVLSYLHNKYYTLYNPTEYWAVHEVTVKFKARVVFQQYIPKKRKIFQTKLYKLCDSRGYTYNMAAYLSKHANDDVNVIPAYGTMLKLIRHVEGSRKMNSCSTIPHNRKGMPANLGPKML